MRVLLGILILLVTSPVDFPLMIIGGEHFPHYPTEKDFDEISEGSFYHKAKGFWAEWFRADGEWWSKFSRFAIWWLVFILLVL